ncbi:MAG: CBS domain-containing protein [Planctomycetota bacterium]
MNVQDVMTKKVVQVDRETSLADAATMMKNEDVGWLPVVFEGRVQGVVSDRDIVTRAVSEGRDAGSTTVGDVMTDDVVWCTADTPIKEAAKMMEDRKIRRLLVKGQEGRPVGALSLGDLAVRDLGHDAAADVLEEVSTEE